MPTEDNKALSCRLIEELWNQKNVAIVDELLAANYVEHASGIPLDFSQGLEGLKKFFSMYLTAFPDVHVTIEDQFAEEDEVMTRMTWSGTHTGELMGIQPTNEQVQVTVVSIDRIADGQIIEGWNHINVPGILLQLGLFSSAPTSNTDLLSTTSSSTNPPIAFHIVLGRCGPHNSCPTGFVCAGGNCVSRW